MVDTAQALPFERGRLPVVGLVQTSLRTFGQAPLFFLGLSLIAAVPGLLHLAVAGPARGFDVSMIVVTIVNLVLIFVIEAAMSLGTFRIMEGYQPSFREGLDLGMRRFLPMLAVTLLIGLAVYVGIILLVVPGIMAACILAVGVPVCALEGSGPIESLRRSADLTKGQRWRIFFSYIVIFVPMIAIGMLNAFFIIRAGSPILGSVLNAILNIFWTAIATIFSTIMYIELRRLKEVAGVATLFD